MTDNITLPREVVKFVLQHLEWWSDDEPQEKEAIEALRAALAAEQPKQEPVAVVGAQSNDIWKRVYENWVRMPLPEPAKMVHLLRDLPVGTPLYTAPPATHPGYVIGSHWLETAYSRICAGEAEADVLRDCGWERVDQALRRDAERLNAVALQAQNAAIDLTKKNKRLRELLTEARGAKWLVVQDNLLDRIDAALRRDDT